MEIKKLKKNGEKLGFTLGDSTPALANTLRRMVMTEIPILAISWINVEENDSALYDEVLSHRLGLIPLVFSPGEFNLPHDCVCEGRGCPSCQVTFALEKSGPCTVYSGDLKSSNKKVKPTSDKFPVVDLLEGQTLKLEAVAHLGKGKDHARYQAANASYQYKPEVKKLTKEDKKKDLPECPYGGIKQKKKGKPKIEDPRKLEITDTCRVGDYKIELDSSSFLFRMESVSGLKPEEILLQATEILKDKSERFRKELKNL